MSLRRHVRTVTQLRSLIWENACPANSSCSLDLLEFRRATVIVNSTAMKHTILEVVYPALKIRMNQMAFVLHVLLVHRRFRQARVT